MPAARQTTHPLQLPGSPPLTVHRATTWRQRLLGLLNRDALPSDEALLIPQCHAIHTAFMSFPIDAVWLSAANAIIGIDTGIKPFRIIRGPAGAEQVLEVAAGQTAARGWRIGTKLPL